MQHRVSVALACVAFAATSALGADAAAQGTMTPTQPPAEVAPTPTQPPPVQQAAPAPAVGARGVYRGVGRRTHEGGSPPARTGFQLGLRTGVQVPLGEVEQGDSMSDSFTPQWAVGFRFGIQAQLHLSPEARWDPWIGYGIGYEIAGASGSKNNNKITAALGGVEFAHLMAGVDYRVNKVIGIGPTADFAIGQYSIASVEATRNGLTSKSDGDIEDKALHQWLLIGVKVTFLP